MGVVECSDGGGWRGTFHYRAEEKEAVVEEIVVVELCVGIGCFCAGSIWCLRGCFGGGAQRWCDVYTIQVSPLAILSRRRFLLSYSIVPVIILGTLNDLRRRLRHFRRGKKQRQRIRFGPVNP